MKLRWTRGAGGAPRVEALVGVYKTERLVEPCLCSGDRSAAKSQHRDRERKQVELKEGDERDGCSGGGGGEAKEGPGGESKGCVSTVHRA